MASREFSKIGAWGVSWGPQKYFNYPNDHFGQGKKAYFEQMGLGTTPGLARKTQRRGLRSGG